MRIVVVGCGKIGTVLVANLSAEGHQVTAVDADNTVLTNIVNNYDVMGVCGNGSDLDILREAAAESCDLFISTTGSDELNMVCCYFAGKLGAVHTIARIRKTEYNNSGLNFTKQNLGLAMAINPDMLAAREIFRILKFPAASKIETFSSGGLEMIEMIVRESSKIGDTSLSELRQRFRSKFLVCAVKRGTQVSVPDGNFVLRAGDRISIIATHLELQKALKDMNLLRKQAKDTMIIGGSRTAIYLSTLLTNSGTSVKIIEEREKRCREIIEINPDVSVINGNGASQGLLIEEGIDDMDSVVTLTGIDEVNILLSIFAGTHDIPTIISKVNNDDIAAIGDKLGLDRIVSPKKIISDIVVRYARALQNSLGSSNIETLYKIMDNEVEVLEFIVNESSKVVGKQLKDLKTRPGVLVAGITRDRKPIIPTGDDAIAVGDRVIIISHNQMIKDISEIVIS